MTPVPNQARPGRTTNGRTSGPPRARASAACSGQPSNHAATDAAAMLSSTTTMSTALIRTEPVCSPAGLGDSTLGPANPGDEPDTAGPADSGAHIAGPSSLDLSETDSSDTRKDPIMNPKRTQPARRIQRQQQPPRQNSRPIRIVVAGWCCMLVLAATILIDAHEVRSTLFFTLIATGMAFWVWARGSIPALITSLVLGSFQTMEQVAYTISDFPAVLHSPSLIVGTLFR